MIGSAQCCSSASMRNSQVVNSVVRSPIGYIVSLSTFCTADVLFERDLAVWWYSKRNGSEAFVFSVENRITLKDVVAEVGPKVPLSVVT